MKTLILAIFISPIFISAQRISNQIDIEVGGSSLLYSLGINTNFHQKDSSIIGFRMGLGYYPIAFNSHNSAFSFVPSGQFYFNPLHFVNGKFTFRVGTSFYFNQSYITYFSDPNNGIFGYTYSPPQILNSFNTGILYNVLKKDSKLSLNFGFDAILAFRDLKENHIDIPVIPWPTIQYGIKF